MTSRKTTLLALTLFTLAPAAYADVLPEDSCTAVGQPCSTAPPDFHHAGVCREQTCTKTVPEVDGALQHMQYSCPRCVANGGQGGAGGTGGGTSAGGARDAGKADGSPDAGDPAVHGSMNCNCVITPANTANTTAAIMFVAGLLAVFKGRRSRRG